MPRVISGFPTECPTSSIFVDETLEQRLEGVSASKSLPHLHNLLQGGAGEGRADGEMEGRGGADGRGDAEGGDDGGGVVEGGVEGGCSGRGKSRTDPQNIRQNDGDRFENDEIFQLDNDQVFHLDSTSNALPTNQPTNQPPQSSYFYSTHQIASMIHSPAIASSSHHSLANLSICAHSMIFDAPSIHSIDNQASVSNHSLTNVTGDVHISSSSHQTNYSLSNHVSSSVHSLANHECTFIDQRASLNRIALSTSTLAGQLTGSHAGHLSANQSGQLPDIHSGRLVGGEIYGGLAGNPIAGCSMTGSHFSGIRPLVQRGFFPDLSSQAFAEGEKK